MSAPVRTAAYDIGSNSILLLVADVHPDGTVSPLLDEIRITRLGKGVDASGRLSCEAAERSLEALRELSNLCRGLRPALTAAAGTSALRSASNARDFLQSASDILGTPVRVISGQEEAGLSWAAVASDTAMRLRAQAMVVDVGGGSTEVVTLTDGGPAAMSVEMGAVRLTERLAPGDPWTGEDVASAAAIASEVFGSALGGMKADQLAGVGGTIVSLACVQMGARDLAIVHGSDLTAGHVSSLARRLAAQTLSERRQTPGLEPERADVIVAGAIIYQTLLETLGLTSVTVSTRGLRYGVALKAAAGQWT